MQGTGKQLRLMAAWIVVHSTSEHVALECRFLSISYGNTSPSGSKFVVEISGIDEQQQDRHVMK